MKQQLKINNEITASEVRVIGKDGANLGVMSVQDAVERAQKEGLDAVLISEKARPPIVKITDYGKYLYEQRKKAKRGSGHRTETKTLQVKIGTGEHDLELKSQKASTFLKEGHRVKIDLFLAGRAKYLDQKFLETRLERILHLITEEYRIADGPKKSPKGYTVILERKKN